MILYASCLHLAWGVTLTISGGDGITSTPIFSLWQLMGWSYWRLIIALILVSGMALYGVGHKPSMLGLCLMIPQQILLLVSGLGSLHAVVLGAYADGVVRPWYFILLDQMPVILAAPLYTTAVITYHGIGPRWARDP